MCGALAAGGTFADAPKGCPYRLAHGSAGTPSATYVEAFRASLADLGYVADELIE